MTVLLVRGDREYLCEPGEELHTDLGVVEVPDDVEPGQVLTSHLEESFTVRTLRGPDLFRHMDRTGAPMMPRDVGLVIGETGAAAGDRVLDAGTGTGVLAAYLGRLGATVETYERDPDFAEQARENMEMAGVDERVTVREGDLVEELHSIEGEIDIITLDTQDAAAIVARSLDLLVSGGFVAVYSPFVEQSREAVEAAREAGLSNVRTIETIQRRMDFDERGSRPSTKGVGHTGYLTFGRNG